MSFVKHPSIEQFRNVVRSARKIVTDTQSTITFTGTVKLHGTYAAVNRTCDPTGAITADSRERVISIESDNAGFAYFTHANRETFTQMFNLIAQTYNELAKPTTQIQISGEWCGGNIQAGVGLNKLPKMFVVFGIRLIDAASGEPTIRRLPSAHIKNIVDQFACAEIHSVYEFKTWDVDINLYVPDVAQNKLVELVEQVEHQCPVAAQLLGITDPEVELIGEGIVWRPSDTRETKPYFASSDLVFKTKGEKHSSSKVRTLKVAVAIDPVKLESIEQFIEYAVNESRLDQGFDKLRELGLEADKKHVGDYIKWMMSDVIKEESDVLVESGLTFKDVQSAIVEKTKNYYFATIQTIHNLM